MYIYIYIYTHIHLNTYIHLNIYMYIYIYMHIYVYILSVHEADVDEALGARVEPAEGLGERAGRMTNDKNEKENNKN